jgi:hypothetical protein
MADAAPARRSLHRVPQQHWQHQILQHPRNTCDCNKRAVSPSCAKLTPITTRSSPERASVVPSPGSLQNQQHVSPVG